MNDNILQIEDNFNQIQNVNSQNNYTDTSILQHKSIFSDNDLQDQIQKCKSLNLSSDPNISNCLAAKYHTLEPTNSEIQEAKFLPLVNILKRVNYIKKVKLPQFKMIVLLFFDTYSSRDVSGNAEANLLGHILKHNRSIKELDISYHNVGIEGLSSLCEGIKVNPIIEKLDISGNYVGSSSVTILVDMIMQNNSLKEINVENMDIPYSGITEIQTACDSKKEPVILLANGNQVQEERLNVWTHVIGLFMSFQSFFLLQQSIESGNTLQGFSRMTFAFSQIILYSASCMFHAVHQSSPYQKNIFDSLDHICIQLLIAGSQTPMCLEGVGIDNVMALMVFLLEWGFVFFGLLMNISFFKQTPAVIIELIFQLVMGWLVVFILPILIPKMMGDGLYYVVAGGLCQTFGVIFFKLGEKIPIQHVVWHIFVVFGSTFMFFALFQRMDIGDGKTMSISNGN